MDILLFDQLNWHEFFTEFTVEIIVGVLLTITPLFYVRSKHFLNILKTKRFEKELRRISKIYNQFKDLADRVGAHRVVLVKATNGGGLPSPGKPLYISVVTEVTKPGVKIITPEWQQRLADEHYIKLLEEVYVKGHALIYPEELPEYSILRGVYTISDTQQAAVEKIGVYGNSFYYLTIHWDKKKKLTTSDVYYIKCQVDNLKRML